jgi:hypothetical protein
MNKFVEEKYYLVRLDVVVPNLFVHVVVVVDLEILVVLH